MKRRLLLFLFLNLGIATVLSASKIHWAALEGDSDKVQQLIEDEGVDVDVRDADGRTPLEWAAVSGKTDTVQLLLHKRADPSARDSKRQTPLHKAVHLGHDKIVQLLLENNSEVNAQDNNGDTPLHLAANSDVVQELLKKGVELNVRNYLGRTPLHEAAYWGREDVVHALVEAGADMHVKDSQGKMAEELAGIGIKDKKVRNSIQQYLQKMIRLNQQLQTGARDGNKEQIKEALNTGASINSPDKDGNTPLHLAVLSGKPRALQQLLKYAQKINFRLRNHEGKTALEEAAYRPEMLQPFREMMQEREKAAAK